MGIMRRETSAIMAPICQSLCSFWNIQNMEITSNRSFTTHQLTQSPSNKLRATSITIFVVWS